MHFTVNEDTPVIRFIEAGKLLTATEETSLEKADELMRKHKIHHLPVKEEGQFTGILSDRDLRLALSFGEEKGLCVGDIMTAAPLWIRETAPLKEAVAKLAEKDIGSLLILDTQNEVIGIFTAHDAVKAMNRLFKKS